MSKRYGYIYSITNSINGKVYIGQTIQSPTYRFNKHVSDANIGSDYALHRAIRKYGRDAFIFTVLLRCNDLESLNNEEERFIVLFDSFIDDGRGYNMTYGGGNSGIRSEETRIKVSNALKGRKMSKESIAAGAAKRIGRKHTPEARAKMSAALKGRQSPKKGKKMSPEAIEKNRQAHLGKKLSAESIAKRQATKASRVYNYKRPPLTAEHKAKISNSMKGKKFTAVHIANRTKSRLLNRQRKESQFTEIAA